MPNSVVAFHQTRSAGAPFGGQTKKKRELLPARRQLLYELLTGAPKSFGHARPGNVVREFLEGNYDRDRDPLRPYVLAAYKVDVVVADGFTVALLALTAPTAGETMR